jgi:hypothetical protein
LKEIFRDVGFRGNVKLEKLQCAILEEESHQALITFLDGMSAKQL